MKSFSQFCYLTEVMDSNRNRNDLARAYMISPEEASDVIQRWNKVERFIDPNYDYFQVPNGKQYNSKDIFSWSRVAKDLGQNEVEAYGNLDAMIKNVTREGEIKTVRKGEEKDYDILFENEHSVVYLPKSEGASCKLGAGTKWCTAATKGHNQFKFYKEVGIVLFYILIKIPGRGGKDSIKYAIALHPDGKTWDVFDSGDRTMSWDELTNLGNQYGFPVDKEFYLPYKGSILTALGKRTQLAIDQVSGATPREEGEDEPVFWPLAQEIIKLARDAVNDPKEGPQYIAYRKKTGYPDEFFLMEAMDYNSMEFYLDRQLNPVGSFDWGNETFQEEIARHIGRLAIVTKEAHDNPVDEKYVQDMDDLTEKVRGPRDGEESTHRYASLRQYISRHMNDEFPALEEKLLKLWDTNFDATEFNRSDEPFRDTRGYLRLVIDIHGRWNELEDWILGLCDDALAGVPEGDSLWVHGISTNRGKTNAYKRRHDILTIGKTYNATVNSVMGYRDWEEHRAYVPETVNQLIQYRNGQWGEDSLPLTHNATNNLKWKSSKSSSSFNDWLDFEKT